MIAAQLRRVASREEQEGILSIAPAIEAAGGLTEEQFLAAAEAVMCQYGRPGPRLRAYEVVRDGGTWPNPRGAG